MDHTLSSGGYPELHPLEVGFGKFLVGCCLLLAAPYLMWVGIVNWLIGGLITVIEQIRAPQMDTSVLVWAAVKAFFFEVPIALGWLCVLLAFAICAVPSGGAYRGRYRFR